MNIVCDRFRQRKRTSQWTALAVVAFVAGMWMSADLQAADDAKASGVPAGLAKVEHPKDNPATAEKISLGKQLFFDKRLSRGDFLSCAGCHDPAQGWSNGTRFATGFDGQKGGRSAPTLINVAYNKFNFWDGRAGGLEDQALGPIQADIEMNMTLPELVKKLNAIEGYRTQFQKVFGADVSSDGVAKAIAAYERTILSGNAPYDRFQAGDKTALTAAAQRGMKLFFNKALCSACHVGQNFTDNAFHNVGIGMDKKDYDVGRYAVKKLGGNRGAFKTPSLRDVARTAPYMHDGSLKTLEDVVAHYNKGGIDNPFLSEDLFPLGLSKEQQKDLVTFLKEGLSSNDFPLHEAPKLPK